MPNTVMLGKWIVITEATLTEWQRIANTVDNALRVGGETGMDMLLNVVPEWNEAVDEANAALEVCWELGNRGLRSEALGWHASGFLDALEKLEPDRPGWSAWNDALLARGVTPPVIDSDTKDAVHKFIDELQLKDLRGKSLADYIRVLRRNVLCRGDVGERLVLVERMRELDPGCDAWGGMATPLRERRKTSVLPEFRTAIESGDQRQVSAALVKIKDAKLEEFFKGDDAVALQAARAWLAVPKTKSELSKLCERCESLMRDIRTCPLGETHRAMLAQLSPIAKELRNHRNRLAVYLKTALEDVAIQGFLDTQTITKVLQQAATLEQEIKVVFGRHEKLARLQKEFRPTISRASELAVKRPQKGGGWDVYKKQARKWLSMAETVELEFEKYADLVDQSLPTDVEEAFDRLRGAADEVQTELRSIQQTEKFILLGTFGLIAIVILGGIATVIAFKYL